MKKIVINIGTPCGLNPHNLHLVRDSIFKQPLLTDFFEPRWHVSMDKLVCKKSDIESSLFDDMYSFTETECGCWGNQGKNALMENVKEGWVILVDDDNVLHYDFYVTLRELLTYLDKEFKFINFKHETGQREMINLDRDSTISGTEIINDDSGKQHLKYATADSGQFVFHHSVWKPYPTKPTKDDDLYDADYWFYQNAFQEDQHKYGNNKRFYFSDHVATFYNRLRW
jgi:hypothetical protein